MLLLNPSVKYAQSWLTALSEFEAENHRGFWNMVKNPQDVAGFVRQVFEFSQGINLPEGWVPSTTLWLIDRNEFKGHINIRHHLNPFLEKFGGHIGYAIRPSARHLGYGMKMLGLALPVVRNLGLRQVLVTCDETNIASCKIIEKNGGRLQNKVENQEGVIKLRYWITL